MTSLTIEPLTPGIGAEIPNLDLSEQLTDSVMKELEQALLDWKVLFFRDQTIDVEDQKRVARWFGELDIHPTSAPGAEHAELIRIAEDEKLRAHNDIWHSDVTFKASPPMGSILRALEMPPVGGDTMFADMYAAFASLSPALQTFVQTLTARHDPVGHYLYLSGAKRLDELPYATHPVVRIHPDTGRKALYVNAGFVLSLIHI